VKASWPTAASQRSRAGFRLVEHQQQAGVPQQQGDALKLIEQLVPGQRVGLQIGQLRRHAGR
jgi:hypothetical protein